MAAVYFCEDVRAVRELHEDLLTPAVRQRPIAEQLTAEAERLLEGHQRGDRGAVVQISNWHPDWLGAQPDRILAASLTLADAQRTVAREYGYADWAAVQALGDAAPQPGFEAAVDALLAGDYAQLATLLDREPDLATARSSYGHRAALLHYAAANGVETHRQCVPRSLPKLVGLLRERGADPEATAAIYGQSTPLALLESSAHPAAAGIRDQALAALR